MDYKYNEIKKNRDLGWQVVGDYHTRMIPSSSPLSDISE